MKKTFKKKVLDILIPPVGTGTNYNMKAVDLIVNAHKQELEKAYAKGWNDSREGITYQEVKL